ncbi:phosphate ABC transporter ATP-binding protein [Limnobacter sp.]|uniref:phosphate ABC transporter ATP-binding protein n=1 Tax=Limnobacter sp. TaxID=2003368 RepID=UPI0027352946|nr:phosphate ABC transporter ATP-binding protein [Limnobacter sp.]MDP3188719.1 phosphate ABC transporter ATP-binding protein [Limnobacter sp.]
MNESLETTGTLAPGATYTLGDLQQGAACCVPTPIIDVQGLRVSYNGITALDDLSLQIHQGCITALIGPSGCGKTSFLSSLNRLTDLIPHARVEGRIEFDGLNIHEPNVDVRALRTHVGMIFQRPNPFPLSVRKNIEMPLREHGIAGKHVLHERLERALTDVGLWDEVKDRLDQSALGLSGGQQQRLCIARALALEPKVLLMDEPCSALDPISSGVVEDLVLRLKGRYTVVIVTHNLAQAKRIANYAAFFWMKEKVGKLIEYGQSRQIFEEPGHELTAAYISGVRG